VTDIVLQPNGSTALAVRLGKLRPLLQEQNRVADSPRVTWCWWKMSQSYHGAPAVIDLGKIE
jgi:hypothetical protein